MFAGAQYDLLWTWSPRRSWDGEKERSAVTLNIMFTLSGRRSPTEMQIREGGRGFVKNVE